MNKNVYLMMIHEFDNLENRNAEKISPYGYMEDEDLTIEFINHYNSSILYSKDETWYRKYQGWDHNTYPYLSYQEISKINFYKIKMEKNL